MTAIFTSAFQNIFNGCGLNRAIDSNFVSLR